MNPWIKTLGKGEVSRDPQEMIIRIHLLKEDSDYAVTLQEGLTQNKNLSQGLKIFGELASLDSNLEPVYESLPDEKGNYQNHFKGYAFHQNLELRLALDMEQLEEIIQVLAQSPEKPRFDISYGFTADEGLEADLLTAMTQDARRRAQVIAQAAGKKLGGLLACEPKGAMGEPTPRLYTAKAMEMAQPKAMEISEEASFTFELLD